jgi:hypothetical protein
MFGDDDDFGDLLDGMGGNELEYKSTYTEIDIINAENKISNQCKKFVESMAIVYAGLDIENEKEEDSDINDVLTYTNKYQRAAIQQAKMEEFSLKGMMFQVAMGKHVLKSLITHLNSGGAVDDTLYERIFKAQTSLTNVTQVLNKYMRTLPSFFKNMADEMKEYGANFVNQEDEDDYDDYDEVDVLALPEGEDGDSYTMFDKPFRGQGALLDKLHEAMKEQESSLEEDIQKAEGIDVSKEGNVGDNPLRGEDGKIDSSDLL